MWGAPRIAVDTALQHAKFSPHDVGPEMKAEAIELLEAIRADLQAAEEARLAALPRAPVIGQPG